MPREFWSYRSSVTSDEHLHCLPTMCVYTGPTGESTHFWKHEYLRREFSSLRSNGNTGFGATHNADVPRQRRNESVRLDICQYFEGIKELRCKLLSSAILDHNSYHASKSMYEKYD